MTNLEVHKNNKVDSENNKVDSEKCINFYSIKKNPQNLQILTLHKAEASAPFIK